MPPCLATRSVGALRRRPRKAGGSIRELGSWLRVKGLDSTALSYESPSEANVETIEAQKGEGCEGFHPVFSQNAKKGPYRDQNLTKPFTPFTNSSIENALQPPSEGDAEQKRSDSPPFTTPSPHATLAEGWEEFVLCCSCCY